MASPTARPTMASADFCTEVRVPRGPLSPVSRTRRRPPEVSSTAFTAHPPDLQPQAFDGYGLRGQSSARPTWTASYPISVRQVAASLHASFRPRLAVTPLRFARTSPPSGCAGDLHPQAVEHARHTTNRYAEIPESGRSLRSERLAPVVALWHPLRDRRKIADAQSHPAPVARLVGLGYDPTG